MGGEEELPDDQKVFIPPGHYVMFEHEGKTKKGEVGFNRFCPFQKINYDRDTAFVDVDLTVPLTPLNSYVGRIIYYLMSYIELLDEELDVDVPDSVKLGDGLKNRHRRGVIVAFEENGEEIKVRNEPESDDRLIEVNEETDEKLTENDVQMLRDYFNMPEEVNNELGHEILRQHLARFGEECDDEDWEKLLSIV